MLDASTGDHIIQFCVSQLNLGCVSVMNGGGTARVTSLVCIKATAVSVRSRCEAAKTEARARSLL